MKSFEGREIHARAAQAREAGKHLEALQLTDQAMLAYHQDADLLGLAEVLADRSLILRHINDASEDSTILIIAKYEMMAAVEIAESSGQKDALSLPYFNLAKVQESLGELHNAVSSYKKAVENMVNNPPSQHNRPAVLADMMIHLSVCEYRSGDKSGLERSLTALADLEGADEVKYNKDVWTSGAHMKIAEMLKDDDLNKAKEHLQKAKEIIDSNPDLKLRAAQWLELSKKING